MNLRNLIPCYGGLVNGLAVREAPRWLHNGDRREADLSDGSYPGVCDPPTRGVG